MAAEFEIGQIRHFQLFCWFWSRSGSGTRPARDGGRGHGRMNGSLHCGPSGIYQQSIYSTLSTTKQLGTRRTLKRGEGLDDLPGHGHVEGPHLLAGGDDLLGRQQEAVVARVAELHAVAAGIVMSVIVTMQPLTCRGSRARPGSSRWSRRWQGRACRGCSPPAVRGEE